MLIVLATVHVDPARLNEMLPVAATMMAATRAEPGCRMYSIAVEDAAAGKLGLAELWDDADALRSHFATPHMAEFQRASAGVIRSLEATMYDASNGRPLSLAGLD